VLKAIRNVKKDSQRDVYSLVHSLAQLSSHSSEQFDKIWEKLEDHQEFATYM